MNEMKTKKIEIAFETPIGNEPKKSNRWIVRFPKSFNLESWVVSETELPSVTLSGGTIEMVPINFKFIDLIDSSTTKQLSKIIRAAGSTSISNKYKNNEDIELYNTLKDGFDYQLECLDNNGKSIEKWEILGCEIVSVNFGDLDYANDNIIKCAMVVKPKDFKIQE